MKAFLVCVIMHLSLVHNSAPLFEEHFIGKSKIDITRKVKERYNRFKLNTSYINNTYNYLKFEDRVREITVLFFLTDSDTCKMIRIMSDYSNYQDLVGDLNFFYNKSDKDKWYYMKGNARYDVTLEEGDWFFTITIKEKEK